MTYHLVYPRSGSGSRNRTHVHCFKGSCPTVRRSLIVLYGASGGSRTLVLWLEARYNSRYTTDTLWRREKGSNLRAIADDLGLANRHIAALSPLRGSRHLPPFACTGKYPCPLIAAGTPSTPMYYGTLSGTRTQISAFAGPHPFLLNEKGTVWLLALLRLSPQ